jgi:hypothetical protein
MLTKLRIAGLLAAALIVLPLRTALADTAPKPTMDFVFAQALPGPQVTIISGTLYECVQSDCSDAAPLQEVGSQHFECRESDRCRSLAYQYQPYHRIAIQFSDGKTRQSNVFSNAGFNSKYKVTIRSDDLLVEAQLSLESLSLGRIVDVAGNYLARHSEEMLGTLSLTIAIEGIIIAIYALLRRRSLVKLLVSVLLANLATQFLLWVVLSLLLGNYLPVLLITELLIWLLESIILRVFPGNGLSWKEALLLSLVMNLASFGIGWLIPI